LREISMMAARRFAMHYLIGLSLLAAWLVSFPGCKEKEPAVDILTLEGKVEKIDMHSDGTGKITVEYYSEKQGQKMLGTGLVTKETEILIDGVASKLADVREGDRVHGEVRIAKRGEQRVQTALKITIERPKPVGEG